MSDFGGFNAHELLSRLRAGSSGANVSSSSSQGGNSVASSVSQNVRGNNSVTNMSYNGSIQQPPQPPEIPSHPENSFFSQQAKPNNLDVAVQRREAMEIRLELEKEIKRLQEQVSQLKTENKSLKAANASLELKMTTSKQKSDDIIAKLRGKLVKSEVIKKTTSNSTSAIASAGPRIGPNRQSQIVHHAGMGGSRSRGIPNVSTGGNPPGGDDDERLPPDSQAGNFAGPTFSELMRRSTPPANDFNDILRKPHLSTGYTYGSAVGGIGPASRNPNPSGGHAGGHASAGQNATGASGVMDMSEFDLAPAAAPQAHQSLQHQQQMYYHPPHQPYQHQFASGPNPVPPAPTGAYHNQNTQYTYGDYATPYATSEARPPPPPLPPSDGYVRPAPSQQPMFPQSQPNQSSRWDLRRTATASTSGMEEDRVDDDDGDDLPVVDIDLR